MEYVVLCLLYAKVYMVIYDVLSHTICLKKDILYMSKTKIQLKKLKNGEKKMKKTFTTNWYIQKIYFSPISAKQDLKYERTTEQK